MNAAAPSPVSRPRRDPIRASDWLRLTIPVLLIAGFIIVAWKLGYFDLKDPARLDAAASRVQRVPWLGAVFVLAYALLAGFAAPVSPLAYGAGALFGLVQGSTYVWIGSLIGGTAGYFLARGVWADTARRLLGRHEDMLEKVRRSNPFLVTLRAQLSPVVPFGAFNYAAGASKIPYLSYIAGTAIGVIPATIAAVYVGERVAAGFRGAGRSAFLVAAAVMLALIGISFLPNAVKKLRHQ